MIYATYPFDEPIYVLIATLLDFDAVVSSAQADAEITFAQLADNGTPAHSRLRIFRPNGSNSVGLLAKVDELVENI